MEKDTILKLVEKISKDRDEGAFSDIFDFLAPKINTYFIKNSLDYENSEELTQEVLNVIWTKANSFDSRKSQFTTWVFTIARNKKIDFYRKSKNKNLNEADIRDFVYPSNKVYDYETEDIVKKIKQELTPKQQKLIKMNFFEQKSHKKIAEELEIPIGTVKSRIRSTLSKMQKFLS